ncbi:hypothetical protein BLNAU_18346 [Blattamonas nauphoetae]|uniref:Uncharacterized protein n=1 Tax=Blattamonas nauphoetae TaxID=2049346 RepID=A0ABQ9X986_9EUKA|nr:hypothetical protein BLNAU_18346 [Blattamonas nauphoetae]
MMFLISKRHVLNGDLFKSFMNLLSTLILIGPFHLPTLEAVLASPIVTTFSSCLTYAEGFCLYKNLNNIQLSLTEWKKEGQEVSQSGKRTIQVLISEGFEDTLEQTINHDKNGNLGPSTIYLRRDLICGNVLVVRTGSFLTTNPRSSIPTESEGRSLMEHDRIGLHLMCSSVTISEISEHESYLVELSGVTLE